MNKRNTEGYVLAYVLIVIAVMGMIAATLMTSTLQVITAQENSIQYMKDKYAAMGEVEKLVAELEILGKDQGTDGYESPSSAESHGKSHVFSLINTYNQTLNSSTFSTTTISDDGDSFLVTVKTDSLALVANIKVNPVIETASYKIPVPTGEKDEFDTPITQLKEFWKYSILGSSLCFATYEITSNGGDTE